MGETLGGLKPNVSSQNYRNEVTISHRDNTSGTWHSHGVAGSSFTPGADTNWVDQQNYRSAYVYVGFTGVRLEMRTLQTNSTICGGQCSYER